MLCRGDSQLLERIKEFLRISFPKNTLLVLFAAMMTLAGKFCVHVFSRLGAYINFRFSHEKTHNENLINSMTLEGIKKSAAGEILFIFYLDLGGC